MNSFGDIVVNMKAYTVGLSERDISNWLLYNIWEKISLFLSHICGASSGDVEKGLKIQGIYLILWKIKYQLCIAQ